MDYFMLRQDPREIDSLTFIGISHRELMGKLTSENPTALYVRSTETAEYMDYMERPAVFISNPLYRMVKKYVPTLELGLAVFIDQTHGDQKLYWSLEDMEGSDCISGNSQLDKLGFITQLILDETKIPEQPLFQVVHRQQRFTIVRLDLVESLLRRGICGFHLQTVDTVRGEQ
ncbi:hypothetical protein [Paenibacillus terrae]|uniref:Uncharacterized protein n=1 Tax=Paenibacillus terrae TaxID=159743 RepID=A0A0D7WTU8_9BACL|nr:hypothetical protein [Paenibacillus terrae]KJD42585.1 hypothetical protein QD47_27360 [Paenibacillus terrae]